MALDQAAVEKLLSTAQAAVNAAGVAEDLRPVAFTKALDLLAGTVAPVPSGGGGGGGGGSGDGDGGGPSTPTDDERLEKIARKTGANATKMSYVYDLDTDDVNVIVQRSKLGSGDAAATRELALLYCAARQAIGFDTQTTIERIRKRVDDMGVYDPKNFATHLKGIDGITVKGQKNAREYKVTQHGFEEAGKLITRLTGGGS